MLQEMGRNKNDNDRSDNRSNNPLPNSTTNLSNKNNG